MDSVNNVTNAFATHQSNEMLVSHFYNRREQWQIKRIQNQTFIYAHSACWLAYVPITLNSFCCFTSLTKTINRAINAMVLTLYYSYTNFDTDFIDILSNWFQNWHHFDKTGIFDVSMNKLILMNFQLRTPWSG